jgi:hypothetical protein
MIFVMFNDLHCSPNTFLIDKIEKNEMGGACSAYGKEYRRIQRFRGETLRKEAT